MNETTSIDSQPFARARRWLVMDDEAEMSELIASFLAQMNRSDVDGFTSALHAMAALKAGAEDFDLVVTDRDMPDLDGMELARHLRREAPRVKVILVSANTDDLTAEDLQRAGIHAVVRKPFTLAWLEAVVRSVTMESSNSGAFGDACAFAQAA